MIVGFHIRRVSLKNLKWERGITHGSKGNPLIYPSFMSHFNTLPIPSTIKIYKKGDKGPLA